MRKYAGTLIKLGVTAVALLLVFTEVDVRQIVAQIGQAQWGWVLFAFGLVNASVVLRAYRWRILLVALGAAVRFSRLVELYFAAGFFNSVLPSGLAGDVVRAAEAAQDVPADVAAGTVIVDRLTGLLALFILALVALPIRPPYFPVELLAQIVVVCVVGLAGGLALLHGGLVRQVGRLVPGRLRPYWAKIEQVLTAVAACGWRAVGSALLVSVLFNLMQIGWWWAAGKSLGYDVPVSIYFYTTPLMALATLMPSIGGLGVRENLAILLFAPTGLTPGEAVSLSLLVFALERSSGLLGAPIYIVAIVRQNRARRHSDSTVPN
ncbi:MAG: flippase-like domain-containing protein [Anaerolineae bacterium]|nr:flippase-like domain-containing protein [Anaerolineae bacterium]